MNIKKVKSQSKAIKRYLLFDSRVPIEQKIRIIGAGERRLPKVLRTIIRNHNITYNESKTT